ncbi:nuclear transport factor 2 family protein [Dokdonella sp.]|uniref:YybH family protein n=1 Tax=Dokdonella sp. TaxID=2291710 RepID=UPI002F424A0F
MTARHASRAMLAAALAVAGVPADAAEPSLRGVAQAHLAAVEARDLDALLATVTSHDKLTLLFPDGSAFTTRAQYVDFHKEWFADRAWHFHGEIVDVIETPQLGHVLARYRYESGGKAAAKDTWLALTFAKERGRWRLVFDQNTRIEPQPAK